MFDTTSLVLLMAATLALLITPGPAVLYVVARSLKQGKMAGFVSTLGIGLGSVVHVIFAALGLSTLLLKSALAFSIVKYMGAAYLLYLGVRTLARKAEAADMQHVQAMSHVQIFRQGFIVNLLNPKTALFFLSFLPQFVDPLRGSVTMQIIILGTIFITMAILSDSAYALVAGTAGHLISGNKSVAQVQKYLAGTIYIGLGLAAAFSGNGQSK